MMLLFFLFLFPHPGEKHRTFIFFLLKKLKTKPFPMQHLSKKKFKKIKIILRGEEGGYLYKERKKKTRSTNHRKGLFYHQCIESSNHNPIKQLTWLAKHDLGKVPLPVSLVSLTGFDLSNALQSLCQWGAFQPGRVVTNSHHSPLNVSLALSP